MVAGSATVKQVISGDSLVLMGVARAGPPPEKQIVLASVLAPKLSMKSQTYDVPDEPFAWESREFLRKLIAGEVVDFVVEYEDKGKEFASVKFKGDDLSKKLVAVGLAKIRNTRPPQCAKNIEELRAAEETAKQNKLGIWCSEASKLESSIRHIQWIANDVAAVKSFVALRRGQSLPAVVEFIRDAGSYRVYFPAEAVNASVVLAGCQIDGFRRIEGSDIVQPEPFAAEAKYFAEVRLLNRDVQVSIEGADDYGNIVGTIIHPRGNISELLLRNGFGKVNDRTAMLTKDATALRSAQKAAQESKLRKWKNFQPNIADDIVREYIARIIEIVSGDCIIVSSMNEDETEERRLYLASIRSPRMGTRTRPDEPWAFEAKELARKKLVGRKVKVVLEYTREPTTSPVGAPAPAASDSSGKMHFVSIFAENGKVNFSELLVQEGLAKVLPHRTDDPSASNYATLLEKEAQALAAKKGLHGAPAPIVRTNDLVGVDHSKQAKSFVESLKRKEKLEGVVDYVFNGGRFKIRIPAENLAIAFALSSIKCPATAGGRQRQAAEFSEEALQFSREHYLQRNVTISIMSCDIRGTFIGLMWHGKDCVNVQLVTFGMAEVVERSGMPTDILKSLRLAEAEASEKRIGLWSTRELLKNSEDMNNDLVQTKVAKETLQSVMVSYINNITDFYIIPTESKAELDDLQRRIQAFIESLNPLSTLSHTFTPAAYPKVGELLLAQFEEDGQWYRAKVDAIDRKSQTVHVCYIDYGNSATVALTNLRQCPPFAKSSILTRHCRLAGLKLPPDMGIESADMFEELVDNINCTCVIESIEATTHKCVVHLCPQNSTVNINEALLLKGLAVYDRKSNTELQEKLLQAQEQARKQRVNIWRHGDIDVDSEEENKPKMYRR